MTGPAITPEQLHYVDAGELLALMAGTLALNVRTREDCELLDAIGREFRHRNEPGDPDSWAKCARCKLPSLVHESVFGLCPWDEGDARANALELVTPEEWEATRPYIFGQDVA